MKNVSKKTLDNLIKFIYTGQVNVAQHNLEEFFNTAKALEIKGLVDKSTVQGASSSSWPIRSNNNRLQFQSTRPIRNQIQTHRSPSVYHEGDNFDQKSINETEENVPSNFDADLLDDGTGYDDPPIDQSFESFDQQWNAENYYNQSDEKMIAPQAKRAKRACSKH